MDLSLDDFIKQKKIGRAPNRPVRRGGPRVGGGGGARAGVVTGRGGKLGGARQANGVARNKPPVVSTGAVKKRVNDLRSLIGKRAAPPVRDAREKLSTRAGPPPRPPRPSAPAPKPMSDARDRLSSRNKPAPVPLMSGRGKYDVLPRRTLENRSQARKPHTYMDLEEQRIRQRSRLPASSSGSLLLRTVDNSRPSDLMDIDPWDEPSTLPYKNMLSKYQNVTRTFSSEESWRPSLSVSSPLSQLSRRMPVLSKRPEPSRSHQSEGFRIVVSNLQPSVTHEDIKELFEDIGYLYSSRVVRPGTAEVVYKSLDDAMKAVDTYHNRQLDGQPMKCFLINPAKQSSSNTSRSSKGSVVPDLIAIHKALFNK